MQDYIKEIWGWDESWQINDFSKAFEFVTTLVIESDAKFVGYYQIEKGEHSDFLRMLIIKPNMRSAGIGRQILERIQKESYDKGKSIALRVFKQNSDAKRFYIKNGWNVIAEEKEFYLMENCRVH